MPLNDIFSREGGFFVVELEDESLKLLTPSRKWKLKFIADTDSYMSFLLQRSQTWTKEEEEEKKEEKQ